MASMNFSVDGEWFSDFAREKVSQGDWKDGLNDLQVSVPELTLEQSFDILSGKMKFIGSSDNGWDYEEDPNKEKIKKEQEFLIHNVFKRGNTLYKVYKEIKTFGAVDVHNIRCTELFNKEPDEISFMLDQCSVISAGKGTTFNDRINHYFESPSDVAFVVRDHNYVAKQVPDVFPPWIFIPKENNFTVSGYVEEVHHDDFYRDYVQYKEKLKEAFEIEVAENEIKIKELERQKELDEKKLQLELGLWKIEILDQSKESYNITANNKLLAKVPKEPFVRWCLRNIYNEALKPKWENICPGSLKMPNDDKDHSDWFVGAGLDLDEAYDSDIMRAAYDHINIIQEKYLKFETPVLSNGGQKTGAIKFCTLGTSPEEIEDGDVLLLTSANPVFETHIRKATKSGNGGVITMTGGKLCHLAVVSRESGVTMMLDIDANNRYKAGDDVMLNPNKGTIRIY